MNYAACLVKTDSAGNMQWNESCEIKTGWNYADSVEQTSDGEYILAGAAYPNSQPNSPIPPAGYFWLAKIGAGNGEGSGAAGSGGIVIVAVGGIVGALVIIALIVISFRRRTRIAAGS
jgi:hypothetical protein